MTHDITEELEAMIDKHGLLHVMTGLELICGEKAEHICSNWQDQVTAKVWDKASTLIYGLVRKIDALGI